MNIATLVGRIRSAHALSSAMRDGVAPSKTSLVRAGLPPRLASRFKR